MKIRRAQSEDVGTVWIINDARRAEDVELERIINWRAHSEDVWTINDARRAEDVESVRIIN